MAHNGWKPYLYSHPPSSSSSAAFDPKPYTRASLLPPAPPKPKQEGPLINFNRHPDSWAQPRYGLTNATPMARNTKTKVAVMRWVQFTLRLLTMIGATGTLVATCFIRNVQDTANWLIRLVVSSSTPWPSQLID